MIYLSENEVGFHRQALGFPSIRGCHAIVYVTDTGLFGLHNFGGDLKRDWPERSSVFGEFVAAHKQGAGAGQALYGVCFATTQRAYGTDAPAANWKGELSSFASAVGFKGSIYGYDLAGRGFPPPAYVYFQNVGSTCVIQVKPWSDGDKSEGPNASPANYQMIGRNPNGVGYALKPTKKNVVTNVTTAGLTTVYPNQL